MKTGMQDSARRRKERGFSLPELTVVIAIMGLFILFAGPAFNEAYRAYKVRAAADDLTTSIRATRYNAVANRAPSTITFNNLGASPPNQYSFVNSRGQTITTVFDGVNIETGGPASITFAINGTTGTTASQTLAVSGRIHDTRSDRYTLTITPSGTVSSVYSTF